MFGTRIKFPLTQIVVFVISFLLPVLCSGNSVGGDQILIITTPAPLNGAGGNMTWPTQVTNQVKTPGLPHIYSFRVQSDIKYRYSTTLVTSRVANKDTNRAQEVNFSVVLPKTAFISKFVMEIDNKTYPAYVKEKEEAKQVYLKAQRQGQTAGLVEKSTRNSNLFHVNVNIKPESKVTFSLTYEELLTRTLGRYEQSISINPDHLATIQDYQITANIEESQNISFVHVSSFGNDISRNESYNENPDVQIERPSPNKAQISWSPTTAAQKKISKAGNSGKFVVQYDVNRNASNGEILVMQGYFVHFFAPTNLKPLKKHVLFILDVSGSMKGRKLAQLKEAQVKILDDLSPEDYFNIITFSTDVYTWSPEDSLANRGTWTWYQTSVFSTASNTIRKPLPATTENIQKAKQYIATLSDLGGTNIHKAITEGLKLIRRYNPKTETNKDGQISSRNLEDSLPANIQSLIMFLTDGQPTLGITTLSEIQNEIKRENEKLSIPIFSLAFGEGADFEFLKKLSLQNKAFARKIYEASDAALQLENFYKEIASPLLSNVKFNYTSPEYNLTDVTVTEFPNLFDGSEIVVAGKLDAHSTEIACDLAKPDKSFYANMHGIGRNGILDRTDLVRFDKPRCRSSRLTTHSAYYVEDSFLERLWAYLTIKQLTEKDLAGDKSLPISLAINHTYLGTPKQKAIVLALKYGFVTPHTSLVVVKPNETEVANADPGKTRLFPISSTFPHQQSTGWIFGSSDKTMKDSDDVEPQAKIMTSRRPYSTSGNLFLYMGPRYSRLGGYGGSQSYPGSSYATTSRPYIYTTASTAQFPKWRLSTTKPLISRLTLDDIVWLSKNDTFIYNNWNTYKISRNQTIDEFEGTRCTNTFARYNGRCQHIRNCVLPEIAADRTVYLTSYFCEIVSGSFEKYAGVCCPFPVRARN